MPSIQRFNDSTVQRFNVCHVPRAHGLSSGLSAKALAAAEALVKEEGVPAKCAECTKSGTRAKFHPPPREAMEDRV